MNDTTSENSSQATGKPPNILDKWNGYADILSFSQDLEISGQYFLLLTDILKKSRWMPLIMTDGWSRKRRPKTQKRRSPTKSLKNS